MMTKESAAGLAVGTLKQECGLRNQQMDNPIAQIIGASTVLVILRPLIDPGCDYLNFGFRQR